jgi:hypothetical protein
LKRVVISLVLLIAVGAALVVVVSCNRVQVLGFSEAAGLKVEEQGQRLTVSEEMTHSALEVRAVRWERVNKTLFFEVLIGPVRGKEGRGDYQASTDIPDDIGEVCFGEPPGKKTVLLLGSRPIAVPGGDGARNVIWSRKPAT